jgi:hypothetical protein
MFVMPRHRILGIALGAILVLSASLALADQENGGAPGSWLSQYATARTIGLGGAFVGAADDASAVVWNPAGLALLVPNEVRFESARLYEDTMVNALNFAVPGNKLPSFGLSVVSLNSGQFDRTNDMNDPLGSFSEGETAYILSVARSINPRFALGANVKMIRQTVEDFTGTGIGFDMGAIANVSPSLRIGASVMNVGGPGITLRDTKETYPLEVRGGF